jgi:hypothetical protein
MIGPMWLTDGKRARAKQVENELLAKLKNGVLV